MNNTEIKTLWKLAKMVWIATTAFWLIETLIFLGIEGWHIKPTNPIEIFCDKIVRGGWDFALNLTIFICCFLIINLNKKSNEN
jgi:hypothetical protein